MSCLGERVESCLASYSDEFLMWQLQLSPVLLQSIAGVGVLVPFGTVHSYGST